MIGDKQCVSCVLPELTLRKTYRHSSAWSCLQIVTSTDISDSRSMQQCSSASPDTIDSGDGYAPKMESPGCSYLFFRDVSGISTLPQSDNTHRHEDTRSRIMRMQGSMKSLTHCLSQSLAPSKYKFHFPASPLRVTTE
jgi:hypothetical protein